jgi:hypothetical protein
MPFANDLRRRAAAGLAVAVLFVAAPARAEEATTLGDAMLGLASGVCTLVYTPAKIVYATGGVGIGMLVWLFSAGNTDTMNAVLKVTAGGDYVVTPGHLRGLQVLKFTGRAKRS